MNQEKFVEIQYQMRQNQQDLQDYLRDLDSWEKEIKEEDKTLKKSPSQKADEKSLPPVRNSLLQKRYKKKKKPKSDVTKARPRRIPGSDFRAWDKFDVDKACEEIDKTSSESEAETDEEWEIERKKLLAVEHKERGNALMKENKLSEAIQQYTQGLDYDPENAVILTNRALALIRQDKFGAAEVDCNLAISLDSSYMKAFYRRGLARTKTFKLDQAVEDFQQVLKIEPNNRAAKAELDKVQEILNPTSIRPMNVVYDKESICHLIYKPPKLRSKKAPLRLEIKEIAGDEHEKHFQQIVKRVHEKQSEIQKRLAAEQEKEFQKYLQNPQTVIDGKKEMKDRNGLVNGHGGAGEDVNSVDTAADAKAGPILSPADIGIKTQVSLPTSQGDTQANLSSSSVGASVPPVPKNFMQFMCNWKSLKKNPEVFYFYFKQIAPCDLPQIFGSSIEADVVVSIISCLKQFYLPSGLDPYPVLFHLAKVGSMSIILMFLSQPEKKDLTDVLEDILKRGKYSTSEIEQLKKAYSV